MFSFLSEERRRGTHVSRVTGAPGIDSLARPIDAILSALNHG